MVVSATVPVFPHPRIRHSVVALEVQESHLKLRSRTNSKGREGGHFSVAMAYGAFSFVNAAIVDDKGWFLRLRYPYKSWQ